MLHTWNSLNPKPNIEGHTLFNLLKGRLVELAFCFSLLSLFFILDLIKLGIHSFASE